ncbi:ATP-binding protein [Actinoplanes sp. GCM10030250]|uniref:ATP-binding protein n=1 Tax=Actinoplanes sp. GCM10030250 TaxID=3273376 RepID=UPI003610BE4F
MVMLDEEVLSNPVRLRAVDHALRTMPGHVARLDDVAALAARLADAPMAAVTLVGDEEEFFLGSHAMPERLVAPRRAPLAYSVCKYVVCADRMVRSGDMGADPDEALCEHLLATEFGIRAFLGVPVRDRDDRPLGSLSVFDRHTRGWTDEQAATLLTIAETLLTPAEAGHGLTPDNGAFLGAVLESLDAGVIACDRTGRVVFANRALRATRGIPADGPIPDDYQQRTPGLLRGPDQRPLTWEQTPMMRALRGEHIFSEDVYSQLPGHRARIFDTTAQPVYDAGGHLAGAVAVAHEVTALRRAERFRACHLAVEHVLKQSRSADRAAPQVLQAVTTTLGWPSAELFLIDDDTATLQSVGHWDSSGLDPDGFFGHTPVRGEGITGRVWETCRAIWVPDLALSQDLRTSHERERVDVCLRRGVRTALAVPVRDGDSLLGVLTCYAGTQEYEPDLLTVLLDGVAAQIGVFVAQRRCEELARQLARAQGDFIDLVGHELRTPLTSITANAAILAEEAAGLDPDCQEMARVIARNAASLQRISDTLLDLAGLESGHLVPDVRPVDLAALILEAAATAGRPGDLLTVETDLPAELHLPADADLLRQMINDLLSNAVRYSPPGSEVHISLRAEDTLAELCIADEGIGTPSAERARAFDRFFRGSNVRHQGTSGSGLGLSLARAIVVLHGGTIRLEENRPTGTVVRVRLPLSGPKT